MPASGERQPRKCEWFALGDALKHFAVYDGRTQTQQHIKPLHWYVACRLVVEGGFHPAELEPRPPFYRRYDERNVVSAPDLAARNRRLEWAPDSPALQIDVRPALDYEPRVAG